MRKLTIAEHAARFMAERRMKVIWYGCMDELHEIAESAGVASGRKDNLHGQHSLNVIKRVLARLERSERFEKRHLGRPARAFVLRKKHGS